jgi:hypothetical protein
VTRNPFVYLAESPVEFFGYLGYALFLLMLVVLGSAYVLRTAAWLKVRFDKNHHDTTTWWGGWLPPRDWAAWAATVPFVLAVLAWAIGALVYLIGG